VAVGTLLAGRNEETGGDHMSGAASTNQTSPCPGPECRLAVYGTLAPGRPNHDQLDGLAGRWIEGAVRGRLLEAGWGIELGYPGIILDSGGPSVGVQLFESSDLPNHWARLDEFEGVGYRRTATTVSTAEGDLPAFIYALTAD
jgi:gamma-glutamylcyclotransferase (GGCT)/AIG2-like uncharacterized protein YtfP